MSSRRHTDIVTSHFISSHSYSSPGYLPNMVAFSKIYIWLFPGKVDSTGSFLEAWRSVSESLLHAWEMEPSPVPGPSLTSLLGSFIPQGGNASRVLKSAFCWRKERGWWRIFQGKMVLGPQRWSFQKSSGDGVTPKSLRVLSDLLFSPYVVPNSLRPCGLQHSRLPFSSPSPRVCSDSCQLSQWCHPSIAASIVPFFSCPQSFPASESCLVSRLFASRGQSIVASALASVFPGTIQGWFPFELTGLISL